MEQTSAENENNNEVKSYKETHPDSFVHLHLHTQYSLLDGAIRLKDLIPEAKKLGVPAIAQTDHGNMFGAIDFYTRCKKEGIKPILGSEIYFTPGSRFDRRAATKSASVSSQDAEESSRQIHHLILLCKNNTGYKNLCKLLSKAYLEGFYYKPRADVELLREYSEGLICTTACLKGEVGYNFFTGQDEKAIRAIEKLQDIFGPDDFYLEIQENGIPEQRIVNEKVIDFATKNNIKLVATNDSHYMTPEDATAQEVLLCIQTGKTYADENRMRMTSNAFYYKTPEEMRAAFHYAPEACDNTLEIADKCNVELSWTDEKGNQIYHLPDYEIDTDESLEEYFVRVTREGLQARFDGPQFRNIVNQPDWEEQKPKYYERLQYEMDLIIQMGFVGYFLIVADFIQWSKDNGIPVGPGRGSGAGSLVAYSLTITNINPLPYNLLFERFINPERISMPDFDVDFCQAGRQRVIEYVTQKYGEDKVGQIITFGKLSAKAVVKDVARVYDLSFAEANMISKLIPDELGINLDKAIEMEPKLQELIETDQKIRQIFTISKRLEGLYRNAGIHAAGVIITSEPLVEYCPLFKGNKGEKVVQFDKDFSELIGLVKFDFLGLKTLTVIDYASNFIKRDHMPDFDIEAIDYEDKKVYDLISEGDTIGVFQLESTGMQDLCRRISPDTLDDITAINALYRPGPMGSGMHDEFVEIKHGRKEESYPFESLKPILNDTYGIIIYQEQVMNIARIVAGYSLGQADMLRKAMGKKKISEMERHKQIFLDGAKERDYDLKIAETLYDQMAKFAEYGFNKSHAVAYSYIAYQTAFLKAYYPAEFYAGLLSTELSNTEKITTIINDCRNHSIEVLAPDVNESLYLFNVVENNLRFGMGAIKGVGEGAVEEIVRERTENGPFTGFVDFCERVNLKIVGKRVIEPLIRVGAFTDCEKEFNRRTMLENMEVVVAYASKRQKEKEMGQTNLFDLGDGAEDTGANNLDLEHVADWDDRDKLLQEAELIGVYVSGHPLDRYQGVIEQMASMPIHQVQDIDGTSKRDMVLAGMIVERKNIMTKKGDRMCFATLEDLSGKIECIVFPKTFLEYEEILASDDPIIMTGQVNLAEEPRKFFPSKIQKLKEQAEERVTSVRLNVPMNLLNEGRLTRLKQTILGHRGTVPLHIIFEHDKGRARMPLGEDFLVNPSPQMAAKINEIFDVDAVKFIIDGKISDVR